MCHSSNQKDTSVALPLPCGRGGPRTEVLAQSSVCTTHSFTRLVFSESFTRAGMVLRAGGTVSGTAFISRNKRLAQHILHTQLCAKSSVQRAVYVVVPDFKGSLPHKKENNPLPAISIYMKSSPCRESAHDSSLK